MTDKELSNTSIFEDFEFLKRLIVGIGEVSEITGVAQRQIRYWEEKGYVKSVHEESGTTRRYDYFNIKKIVGIQNYLNEGYTLEAAVKKNAERFEHFEGIFRKFADRTKHLSASPKNGKSASAAAPKSGASPKKRNTSAPKSSTRRRTA